MTLHLVDKTIHDGVKWMAIPVPSELGCPRRSTVTVVGDSPSVPALGHQLPTKDPSRYFTHPEGKSGWKPDCRDTCSPFNNQLNLGLWRDFPTGRVDNDLYHTALLFVVFGETQEPVFCEVSLRLCITDLHFPNTLFIQ